MVKKKDSIFYTVFVCLAIIALILIVFMQVIFGDSVKQPKKEISIILYSAGNRGWESFEQGFKQAEGDFPVNINCVILRDGADYFEQFEAIEREIASGAEGIIVAVSDCTELYNLWLGKTFDVPIIAVESGFDEITIPLISADNYEMGRLLGEAVLSDFEDEKDLVVAIDSELSSRDSVRNREQGFRDALEGKARIISLRAAVNGEGADAAVAFDKESLLSLSERSNVSLSDTKKYGIGSTPSIVAALDQGRIEKLVFQNEFNMGYLAVEALLDEMEGIGNTEEIRIEAYCMSSEDLYETPYEQLLFPIVE